MRSSRRLRRRVERERRRIDAPVTSQVVHHLFKTDADGNIAICECCGRPMEWLWIEEEDGT